MPKYDWQRRGKVAHHIECETGVVCYWSVPDAAYTVCGDRKSTQVRTAREALKLARSIAAKRKE